MDKYLIPMYLVYAGIAVTLTVTLARVLYRNGAVFLRDVFADSEGMAEAVNNLLVIGFFMLTSGMSFVLLRSEADLSTAARAAEELVSKLGVLLLSLGAIHFVNVYVLNRIRHRHEVRHLPPPVAPQVMTAPPSPPMPPASMAMQPPAPPAPGMAPAGS